MNESKTHIFPIIEDVLEMIILFDQAGKVTYANAVARQKLEYGDDLSGVHISEIFPNTFQETEELTDENCVTGEDFQNLVAYRKNHTCFPVEAKMTRGSDDGRDVYICMANDILKEEYLGREVERVREEAQLAAKVKSEFVANVTHELRTPVNGILGNIREMKEREWDEKSTKQLQLIERCCDDMNKIINNILDFSKLEAGKFTLEPRKFHFRNMLDYVKGNHINKITEKGLEFFMTVSPRVPEYVIGDELRIVQVLNNLLSNAQKFTSLGKITLEVLRTAQMEGRTELFFIISDTGIGIDQADRDKLFQSFSQVDASISRKYGGTGLGLNICKQLVELMGGRIDVESEKNKGSTFSFSIWVESCDEEAEPHAIQDSRKSAYVTESAENGAQTKEDIKSFGAPENADALKRNLSKLILCVEMENWEKAEMFMDTVRQLTEDAPHEVKRKVLRLKMAIQKENYEKVTTEFAELNNCLQPEGEVHG